MNREVCHSWLVCIVCGGSWEHLDHKATKLAPRGAGPGPSIMRISGSFSVGGGGEGHPGHTAGLGGWESARLRCYALASTC